MTHVNTHPPHRWALPPGLDLDGHQADSLTDAVQS